VLAQLPVSSHLLRRLLHWSAALTTSTVIIVARRSSCTECVGRADESAGRAIMRPNLAHGSNDSRSIESHYPARRRSDGS